LFIGAAAGGAIPSDAGQPGVVLDILGPERRTATAAKRCFQPLRHGTQHKPRRLVPDGLRGYGVTHREVLPEVRHRTSCDASIAVIAPNRMAVLGMLRTRRTAGTQLGNEAPLPPTQCCTKACRQNTFSISQDQY
jgi:hypothetical protein